MKKTYTLLFSLFIVLFATSQTKYEIEQIKLINLFRTNPNYGAFLIDSVYKNRPGRNRDSVEMKKCVFETIQFLKNQKPLNALQFDTVMYNALKNYNYQEKKQVHTTLWFTNGWSENYTGNSKSTIEDLFLLIVDKKILNKGHRMNIFNSKTTKVAVKEYDVNGQKTIIQEFR